MDIYYVSVFHILVTRPKFKNYIHFDKCSFGNNFRMPFHRVDMSLYESTQESSHRYLKTLCIWSPDLVKKKKQQQQKNCVLNIKLKSGVSLQWQEVAQG